MREAGERLATESAGRRFLSFMKRNWPIWTMGGVAVVVTTGAILWWVWLPGRLESLVGRLEEGVGKLTGTKMTHKSLALHGIERLTLEDVTFGEDPLVLMQAKKVEVDVDPWAFEEGLPLVLAIRVDGASIHVRRFHDGTDNVTPIIQNVQEYLRNRKEGGEKGAGVLGRLLRQAPRVVVQDVSVVVDQEGANGEVIPVVSLGQGKMEAYRPGVSKAERKMQLDASFVAEESQSAVTLAADVDLGNKVVQALAQFEPPLPVKALGQKVEVARLQVKSNEFAEVILKKVVLANPISQPADFEAMLLKAGETLGVAAAPGYVRKLLHPEEMVDTYLAPLRERLKSMHYPDAVYDGLCADVKKLVAAIAQRIPQEANFETIELDSVRVLLTEFTTPSGYVGRKVRLSVERGGPMVEATGQWVEEAETGRVDFDVTSPGRLVQVRGYAQKEGDHREMEANVQWNMEDPHLQLAGTIGYNGLWNVELKGQIKAGAPALALSAEASYRDGKVYGQVEGSVDIPGLVTGKVAGTLAKTGWNLDFKGSVVPPTQKGLWSVDAALDSVSLLRRLTLESDDDVILPVADQDVRFKKARLGRDSVLHIENVAVVPRGADVDRAALRVADVALTLTEGTLGTLPGHLNEAKAGGDMKALLGRVLKKVEIVEPVLVLTQPPKLPGSVKKNGEDENVAQDKILDALEEERKASKVVMHEPIRKALQAVVVQTGSGVRSLVDLFLKLGDMFPIQQVLVKEGRFEYTDAVSPQDRLLNELSHFNATVTKVTRPGLAGGQFTIDASFMMPSADMGSGSTLKASVDLGTGDMEGDFSVEKLALYPYRFFFPSALVPDRLALVKDAKLGFQYRTETGRFVLWGAGQVTEMSLVSSRISDKPIEHLSFGVTAGDSADTGLVFDLGQKKLFTAAPIAIGFGKIPGMNMEFSVDASVPDFPKFEWRVRIPDLPVNDLLESIPKPLRASLEGLQVDGSLGFTLGVAGDSANLNELVFSFTGGDSPVQVSTPAPNADFHRLSGSFVHKPFTAPGRRIPVGSGPKYWPLERISPWLVLAVTTTEDGGFFRHGGFNTLQIKNSIGANLEVGRFVRGASTITMQLMKNLFLSHEKTLARKFQEIILTWLVERELGKEKIIEVYLNIIEWGSGVYGVKEACDHYFNGLPPENLTAAQAAFLASFIPYPRPFDSRWSSGFKGERTKTWEKWWGRRLKTVKQIVRAMELNCGSIESRCPNSIDYCTALHRVCIDPAGELERVKELKSLDELFKPGTGVGPGMLPTDEDATGADDGGTDDGVDTL